MKALDPTIEPLVFPAPGNWRKQGNVWVIWEGDFTAEARRALRPRREGSALRVAPPVYDPCPSGGRRGVVAKERHVTTYHYRARMLCPEVGRIDRDPWLFEIR